MDDHYATLEVSKTATLDEIRSSFRRLARQWHPDRNPTNREEASRKFRKISEAYDVLSKAERRKNYDRTRDLTSGIPLAGGWQMRVRAAGSDTELGDMPGFSQFLRDMESGSLPSELQQLVQQLSGLSELIGGDTLQEHLRQFERSQRRTTSKATPSSEASAAEKKNQSANRTKPNEDRNSTASSATDKPEKAQKNAASKAADADSAHTNEAGSAAVTAAGRPATESADPGQPGSCVTESTPAGQSVATAGAETAGDGDERRASETRRITERERRAAAAEARMKANQVATAAATAPATAVATTETAATMTAKGKDKNNDQKEAGGAGDARTSENTDTGRAEKNKGKSEKEGRKGKVSKNTDRKRSEKKKSKGKTGEKNSSAKVGEKANRRKSKKADKNTTTRSDSNSTERTDRDTSERRDRAPTEAQPSARAAAATSGASGGGAAESAERRWLGAKLRQVLRDWQSGRPPAEELRQLGADIAAALAKAAAEAGIGEQRQQRGLAMNFPFNLEVNHYEVLEVERTASQQDIRAAYRRLAKQWHPDKNKNNREEASRKFQQISDSYSILSNETKRKLFDALTESGLSMD